MIGFIVGILMSVGVIQSLIMPQPAAGHLEMEVTEADRGNIVFDVFEANEGGWISCEGKITNITIFHLYEPVGSSITVEEPSEDIRVTAWAFESMTNVKITVGEGPLHCEWDFNQPNSLWLPFLSIPEEDPTTADFTGVLPGPPRSTPFSYLHA